LQHLRIRLQQFLVVTMDYRKKKKIVLPQMLLDPADDHRAIRIADFFRDNADGIRALQSQRAREKIRP